MQHFYDTLAEQVANTLVSFFQPYLVVAPAFAKPVHALLVGGTFTSRKDYPTETQLVAGILDHYLTTCHAVARTFAEVVRATTQRLEVSQQTINSLRTAFLDDSFSEIRATVLSFGEELRDLDARLASESSLGSGLRDMAGGAVMGKAVHYSLGGRSSSAMPAVLGAMAENLAGMARIASAKKAQEASRENCLNTLLAQLERLPSLVIDQCLTLMLPAVDRECAHQATNAVQRRMSQCTAPARAITQTLLCFYALDVDRVRDGRTIFGRAYDVIGAPFQVLPGVSDYYALARSGKEMEQRYPIQVAARDMELAIRGDFQESRSGIRTQGGEALPSKLPDEQPTPLSPATDGPVMMPPTGAVRSQRALAPAVTTPRTPFWSSPWLVVAMVILVWPLGLYMLWRSPSFSRRTKWFVTAGIAAIVLAYMASGAGRR